MEDPKTPAEVIQEFNSSHHYIPGEDCLFVEKLREAQLSESHIAKVIEAIDDTCPQCFNNERRGCTCCRDE